MAGSGGVTIAGGNSGINTAFTVTGTATLGYAQVLSNVLDTALSNNLYTLTVLPPVSAGGTASVSPLRPGSNLLSLYEASGGNQTVSIPGSAGYFLDTVSGALTVEGSAGGHDTVLGPTAVNSSLTYIAEAGGNTIDFVSGNNTYDGSKNTVGGDTVVAGTGYDTITTGVGATTVFSGTGSSSIYLNDTAAGAQGSVWTYNDKVWLLDGTDTVWANGNGDFVGMNTGSGETVYGGSNASQYLGVLLSPADAQHSDPTAAGHDSVVAGAGHTAVFLGSSDNTIIGGSGTLIVVATGAVSSDTIQSGTGPNYVFGTAGATLTLTSATGANGPTTFVAGGGAETFDASGSHGIVLMNGGNSATDTSISDTLIGGSGKNIFTTGSGNETLIGGSGDNVYQIAQASSAGTILLQNFGMEGQAGVLFAGYDQSAINSAVNNGSAGTITVGGQSYSDYTITLNDGTSVTFVGINSAAELNSHIL